MEGLLGPHTPLPALFVLCGLIALLAVLGATEPLARRGYAWRVIAAPALAIAINLLNNAEIRAGWVRRENLEIATHIVTYLVTLAAVVAVFRTVGRRLVDLRVSRWWSLLCLLPVINVILAVGLLFPASRPQDS